MSNILETHAGNDEITDLAYEAADHTQDFAEEIEDAVSAPLSYCLHCHMTCGATGCCPATLSCSG